MYSTFGQLCEDEKGYYKIVSIGEGNFGKLFHRVIYENYHKLTLLPDIVIHHKDGNKKNNCIMNLEMMTNSEHTLHHQNIEIGESYEDYLKNIERKYCK